MRVIRPGELPQDPIWIGRCDNCYSLVEAKQSELFRIRKHKVSSSGIQVCPMCEVEMIFYPNTKETK